MRLIDYDSECIKTRIASLLMGMCMAPLVLIYGATASLTASEDVVSGRSATRPTATLLRGFIISNRSVSDRLCVKGV